MSRATAPQIDYTAKDFESLREAMLELARQRLPEWTDHSASDPGVVLTELFAYMGDILFWYLDRAAMESYPATARERRSVINLLRLIGYELRPPRPASAELTLLFDKAASGTVTIPWGAEFKTAAGAAGAPIHFFYVHGPLDILLDKLAIAPHQGDEYRIYPGLPLVQADRVVEGEIVGSSDGSHGQRHQLAHKPLIDKSLTLRVDEGAGPKIWEERETLLNSLSLDEHYTVRRDDQDAAWVEFGDAKYGKAPRRGHNNITAEYLAGGGAKGNVPPNSITKAVTSVPQLAKAFNPQDASGGADREAIGEAVSRGPHQFRAMGRAVTAHDYESQARNFGVGKARARAAGWNRIELYIAPAGGGYPSDTLKEDLHAYFESRRIMTSILEIRDPIYVPVLIEGRLEVEAYYFTDQVQQQVEGAVRDLFDFQAVDFEQIIYISKIYEAIEAVEGVKGVNISRLARGQPQAGSKMHHQGPNLPEDGSLRFGWDPRERVWRPEIPFAHYPQGIRLEVQGGRRDS